MICYLGDIYDDGARVERKDREDFGRRLHRMGWNGTERVGYGLILSICIIFSCWNGNDQDSGDELSVSSV